MLAGLGNIIIKRILRVTGCIRCADPQKILSGRKRIHCKLRQDQIFLPEEYCVEQIIFCKFDRIIDLLDLIIIGRIPIQMQLTVCCLRYANVKWHGLTVALPVVIIVFFDLRPDALQNLFVFGMRDRYIHPVWHLPDIRFRHTSVMFQHGLDTRLIHVSIKLLHGGIQHITVTLCLQTAPEQYIAPVVAHAAFPAFRVRELDDLTFPAAEHTVIVPVPEIPFAGVLWAVQVDISILSVCIAGQQLKRHPIGDIFLVKIRCKELILHGRRFIVENFQHFDQFGVVTVSLYFQPRLKCSLVICRVC